MPPTLALLLTLGFIAFLFRRDFREKPNLTTAFWIPFAWVFIIASKTVTQWLSIFGVPGLGATSAEEGSSLDALVFLLLIVKGVRVLNRRRVSLAEFGQDNQWLIIFMIYCFLAIFWSDFPFVSLKRWIKILGHPIMALIIFTEPDPIEATVRLMKRVAYLIFPISILWIKYYPALGRQAGEWGAQSNIGIAGNKNELGAIAFAFTLFFAWYFLQIWRMQKGKERRDQVFLTAGLLFLSGYCLRKSHSSTSVLSCLLGLLLLVLLGLRVVNKRRITAYVVAGFLIVIVAQLTFDVYGSVVDLTGHGSTIEGRGRLWDFLLQYNSSPIFGTGFESFWLGDRLLKIWNMPEFWWRPTQAHNGYLETYINLGIVGLFLLAGWIVVTFNKCRRDLVTNFQWGRLTFAYLISILAHNWTEAGFKGLSVMYFIFFMIAIDYSRHWRPTEVFEDSSETFAAREVEVPMFVPAV